jgi:hypothetical protein
VKREALPVVEDPVVAGVESAFELDLAAEVDAISFINPRMRRRAVVAVRTSSASAKNIER